jgi:hypothetical protein
MFWIRLGSVALKFHNHLQCLRAFLTAHRLGAPGDDALFGAGICAGSLGKQLDAMSLFEAAAIRGGPRRPLAALAAFLNSLRGGYWKNMKERRRQVLFSLWNQYLPAIISEFDVEMLWKNEYGSSKRYQRVNTSAGGGSNANYRFESISVWNLIQPHETLVMDFSPDLFLSISAIYAHSQFSLNPYFASTPFDRALWKKSQIVIAYVSSDFTAHATSHLLKGAFAYHDSSKYTVHCISLDLEKHPRASHSDEPWHELIRKNCNVSFISPSVSAREGATFVQELHVVVLINLNGWTAGHRNDIFQQRPAPLQV